MEKMSILLLSITLTGCLMMLCALVARLVIVNMAVENVSDLERRYQQL